jgi:hypothetical protein
MVSKEELQILNKLRKTPLHRTQNAKDFPRTRTADDFNPLLTKEGKGVVNNFKVFLCALCNFAVNNYEKSYWR